MARIIIHTPQNDVTAKNRFYNIFFLELISILKTRFNVQENTFYELAHQRQYEIKLLSEDCESYLLECEMIIENQETQEFVVLSVSDDLTGAILNHQTNPKCKKILLSQFNLSYLQCHLRDVSFIEKYSPWIYFPLNDFDFDEMFQIRNNKDTLVDKFCFWGSFLEHRKIISLFDPKYFDGGPPIGDFYPYAKNLLNYKAAFSVSGRAEFCYRDIENFSMGIPIIRFEFVNQMYKPLIPNFHYISVERPEDLISDNSGEKHHAKLIENKFIEIKDDLDFLNFISNNARKYWEDFLRLEKAIDLTYKILELDDWK